MSSFMTILQSHTAGTKRYEVEAGQVKKSSVVMGKIFDSMTLEVSNISDIYEAVVTISQTEDCFFIRGRGIQDQMKNVTRTKMDPQWGNEGNFTEVPLEWVCLDFDRYDVGDLKVNSIEAIEYLIDNHCPEEFKNVTYVYQWSMSAGLEYEGKAVKPGTNVHLFFYLNQAVGWNQLKTWFAKQRADGFDDSTFRTVTPIFVSSHCWKSNEIKDTIGSENRVGIVIKDYDVVSVPNRVWENIDLYQSKQIEIPEEMRSNIMKKLNEIGCIYKKTGKAFKLWHRGEKTPGDWFVYANNPTVVHHHIQKSKSLTKWLWDFWAIRYDAKEETTRELVAKMTYLEKVRKLLKKEITYEQFN